MNKSKIKTLRFSEEELDAINEKMARLGMTSFSQYMRKMGLYGFIVDRDNTQLKLLLEEYGTLRNELISIGTNINQIAKKLNSCDSVHTQDIQEINNNFEDIKSRVEKSLDKVVKDY